MGKSTSPEILIAELYRKVQECQPTRLNLIAAAIAGTVNDFVGKDLLPTLFPIQPMLDIGKQAGEQMGLVPTEIGALSVGFFLRACGESIDVEVSPQTAVDAIRTVLRLKEVEPDQKAVVDKWVTTSALAGFSLGSWLSASEIRYPFVRQRMEEFSGNILRLRPADQRLHCLDIPIKLNVGFSVGRE